MGNRARAMTYGQVVDGDLRRVVGQTDEATARHVEHVVQRSAGLDRCQVFGLVMATRRLGFELIATRGVPCVDSKFYKSSCQWIERSRRSARENRFA